MVWKEGKKKTRQKRTARAHTNSLAYPYRKAKEKGGDIRVREKGGRQTLPRDSRPCVKKKERKRLCSDPTSVPSSSFLLLANLILFPCLFFDSRTGTVASH